jgi:hypothetical protein
VALFSLALLAVSVVAAYGRAGASGNSDESVGTFCASDFSNTVALEESGRATESQQRLDSASRDGGLLIVGKQATIRNSWRQARGVTSVAFSLLHVGTCLRL